MTSVEGRKDVSSETEMCNVLDRLYLGVHLQVQPEQRKAISSVNFAYYVLKCVNRLKPNDYYMYHHV